MAAPANVEPEKAGPRSPLVQIGVGVAAGLVAFGAAWGIMKPRGAAPAKPEATIAKAATPAAPVAQPAAEPAAAPASEAEPAPVIVAKVAPKVAAPSPVESPAEPPSEPAVTPSVRQALTAAPAPPRTAVLTTADIVDRYEPSVALIKGKGGSGTGFIMAPGIIATNSHVIDGEFIKNLEVRFPSADEANKGPLPAELLYEDTDRDLAFLAVKTKLPPCVVASSYRYRKGEDVTVIGNPGVDGKTVLENAISRGVMSSKAELNGQNYYQLGIAVNPGNSGGPVFDSTGQVIGVVTLRIPGKEELSFCIPVEELRSAMTTLGTQSDQDLQEARATHRVLSTFKALSSGGALYGLGVELHFAARAAGNSREAADQTAKFDEAVATLEKSILVNSSDEARTARNDLHVIAATRKKVGELADSYKRLRDAFQAKSGAPSVQTIKSMKAAHRKIVAELGKILDVDLPQGMNDLMADHLVTSGRTVVTGQLPVSPAASLRDRMLQRRSSSLSSRSRLNPRNRLGR